MNRLLADATLAIGRLDGAIQNLPNPDLFVYMYVRKEAVLSSQIEGTQSSLSHLLEAEAELFDAQRPKDVPEVINYVRAMNYGLERLRELPVSVRLIREIHKELLQNVRGQELSPGDLRTSQNWIGPAGCTLSEARFVPPPPDILSQCLGDLEEFFHQHDGNHDLVRIGLAHAQFETIHPFLDGNGRVGRLLITFLLCEKNILEKPALYLSHYFKANRQEYYDRLQAIRDNGDWEGWLVFFLTGVKSVSEEATLTARRIVHLREDHRKYIQSNFGARAGNATIILERLYEQPILQVNAAVDLLNVSYPVANKIVTALAEAGIIREITGQYRNRVFEYTPYIDLFSDRNAS